MASGRVEGQPPALPVKKHRSNSTSRSSTDTESLMLSPVGVQSYLYNDVFSDPTDCHAERCPIHQRYGPSQHQERFFSDCTPPPVPRKKLTRTLSLPGVPAPAFSAPPPPQISPQDFDNPLYMLAPAPSARLQEEAEDGKPAPTSAPPLPLSQLSFDTPDEHLPYLFRGFDDQRVVSQGIQRRHLLFLRSMAQSVEAEVLLQGGSLEGAAGSHQPQDFLLCKAKQVGDAVYYGLRSPRFPGRVLGLKVQNQTDAPPAPAEHQSSHVNVLDVIAHFHPSHHLKNESISASAPAAPFQAGCTVSKAPHRGSTESNLTHSSVPSVQSLLRDGHSLSVERDLPRATLEDFLRDSSSLQSSDRLLYDRQLCVLLVQVLTGLQHLYNLRASAAELSPRGVLLVWPSREQSGPETDAVSDGMEWEETGRIQTLWRTQGSPRVVLTPGSSSRPEPHSLHSIKSQIGTLIQSCLNPQDPTESRSLFRRGLVYLSSRFQADHAGLQMAEAVATLQALLWGPRVPLFNLRGYAPPAVHNWLTIKRALLVMKLAEKGLIQDQSRLDWEDCMCLQYLSFTDPETIVSVTSQLWLNLKLDP